MVNKHKIFGWFAALVHSFVLCSYIFFRDRSDMQVLSMVSLYVILLLIFTGVFMRIFHQSGYLQNHGAVVGGSFFWPFLFIGIAFFRIVKHCQLYELYAGITKWQMLYIVLVVNVAGLYVFSYAASQLMLIVRDRIAGRQIAEKPVDNTDKDGVE